MNESRLEGLHRGEEMNRNETSAERPLGTALETVPNTVPDRTTAERSVDRTPERTVDRPVDLGVEKPSDPASETPIGTADLVERAEGRPSSAAGNASADRPSLFPETELGGFRQKWQETQTEFVDDPRTAVRHADELVASLMKRLAEVFAGERERLEHDWDRGENASTEDLRQVLRRYRSFFDRLLSV
jgi:hypothetical protein